jgi:hypothetical protein
MPKKETMYINLNYLEEKNIKLGEFICLQIIKQNRNEDCSEYIEKFVNEKIRESLLEKDLIMVLKQKTDKDTFAKKVRITSKANDILNFGTTPDVEEGDERMANYLIDMYLGKADGRSIGNKKNVIKFTAQFRKMLSLSLYEMYWLCDLFISETKYTLVLEKIFFDSNKHRYGEFKNHLEDSKLYQFFEENKQQVLDYWKIKIK